MANKKKLIIVESPSKARTIQKYVGADYTIKASVGHVRDLAKKELGIDVHEQFKPHYVVSPDKKKVISELRKALKDSAELYLATDLDREGEAIAWHLIDELKPKIPVKRMVFHEITKSALQDALHKLRSVDMNLVAAQETRRIMDRLFGFQVSEKLWKAVKYGLSAGRVQSPAIKLVVDREKLRAAFSQSEYWSVDGIFKNSGKFPASLFSYQDKRIASGKDFDPDSGDLARKDRLWIDEAKARQLSKDLLEKEYHVSSVEKKAVNKRPYPPFITSTLQQQGVRSLRVSSGQVMAIAQKLYEEGYITYMRTDSMNLSQEALSACRKIIQEKYGADYLPEKARVYRGKVKNAQEAHEAIRPAGNIFRDPASLRGVLDERHWKLYDLIYRRTVASQMTDAKLQKTNVKIKSEDTVFQTTGQVILFPGYFKMFIANLGRNTEKEDSENMLPNLEDGQKVDCLELKGEQHFTKPKARFTEATLIKELEALGIGRPSTYASILSTIGKRGYIRKVKGTLIPTFTAFAVVKFLENYFKDLTDMEFTANLEESLDSISRSEMDSKNFLQDWYFGGKQQGLENLLKQEFDLSDTKSISSWKCDDGENAQIKIGRFGVYLQKGNKNLTLPEDTIPGEFNSEQIKSLFAQKNAAPDTLGTFPDTGEEMLLKVGPYGPYVQTGKKMKSLLPGMKPEEATPEIAIALLSLPRTLGTHPESGDTITADLGRYGPYLKCGKKNRSVGANLLEIDLEEAVKIIDSPVKRGSANLRELGKNPEGKDIVVKKGRYGPYVTDGSINATIPRSSAPEDITLEQALEMLAAKAAKGGGKSGSKVSGTELGEMPGGVKVMLKSGRYGPYVSDGKVNATIPKNKDADSLSLEDAIELIKAKAAKPKRGRKKK